MNKKLFVGTTNGLELWVDEQVLERLKLELEDRLKRRRELVGNPKIGFLPRPVERQIQEVIDNFRLENDCWLWCGAGANSYGRIRINSKRWILSRFMFLVTNNPEKMPVEVCHHCDNPSCGRPDHLFAGNQKLNAEDRDRKGRAAIGERHSQARLTAKMISEIRNQHLLGRTGVSLAKEYGVTDTHIAYIVKRKRWRSI